MVAAAAVVIGEHVVIARQTFGVGFLDKLGDQFMQTGAQFKGDQLVDDFARRDVLEEVFRLRLEPIQQRDVHVFEDAERLLNKIRRA